MPDQLTALIVDDEPASRSRVRNLLKEAPDVEIVAECEEGEEAVAAIDRLAPSIVFLDVQMPGVDGFEVLRRIDPERMPHVIFVTAFDRYAVDAFEVRALDYLVKPVRRDRFRESLARAREVLASRRKQHQRINRVLVRTRNRILWVPVEMIDWIEAAGNYARIHTGAEGHLLRETMSTIEERLDPARFVRVHRSAIVNVECVREVYPIARGEYVLLLRDGVTRVPLSRTYRAKFEFVLGDL